MAFTSGDRVHVAMLGTGVVREVRNGGRYLIELKGRSVVVLERQLAAADPDRRVRKPADSIPAASHHVVPTSPRSIDLHGKTTLEAVDALDAFLNDALLEGAPEVHVIHGRTGGRLRRAVHVRLKETPSVRTFHVDPHNAGVTIVTL